MPLYDAFISYSHAKDKPIAGALQSVIQTLGKAWYRRRALRVFRDDTSLSATPHLWPSIEKALGETRYLILLASPEAAASPWIAQEVAYWLKHKSPDTLFIGLTDGELSWDTAKGDFAWSSATPLPEALKGRFAAEPKWVDLTVYRDGADPHNARFIELGADFAAAIHGMPKEDLLSQEVRQQRRALTLAMAAAASLLVLAGAAVWQWGEAENQRSIALEERDTALANQSRALAKTSQDALKAGNVTTAKLLALEALPGKGADGQRPYVVEAERALRAALTAPQEIFRIRARPSVRDGSFFSSGVVTVGNDDVFLTDHDDVLRYNISTGRSSRIAIPDQPTAVHLADNKLLIIGTNGHRIFSGVLNQPLDMLAELSHDITELSSSVDGTFILATGTERWSLLDGQTGKVIKENPGRSDLIYSPAVISASGKVVYEDDAQLKLFNPLSNSETVLHKLDGLLTGFAIDKSERQIVVLESNSIIRIELPTGKRSVESLPRLSEYWHSLTVSEDGNSNLVCAFRMPICLWAGTPLAHAASWADAVAFGSSGDEVITFDGTAYFWNALSQGSYEYAITEPEFKLKLLGNSLVDVRFFQDPNHFVTVTTASGEEGIDQEIIVQGWMKSITRLRSAESKLGKFSKTAARASDGDLWFEPEKQSALLYDFDRDELANVPLAASDEDIVKICTDPRLIMLRNGKRLELWQATGSAVQEVAVPDEIVASLVNDQPVDLICGQQTVAIAEGNNIVLWKLGGGGAPLSIDLVAPIKHLRTLDADNLLAIDSGGTAYLMNSRGEKKASGATDLFNSIDESSSLREACFSEGRGALLFGRSDGGTDYLIQFSVTGANLSFSVHPNLNEPFSTVNRRCTLVAYHAFRTREAGVFDLKNNTRMLDFRLPESESWGIDYLEGKNGIVALSNVGLYFLRFDDDLDRTVDKARKSIVACLTPEEREALSLAPEPPHWCITGPGHETDTDPAHWEPKPPYDTDAWKEWLLAARGARQTGDDPPPVPRPQEAEAGVEVH